MKSFVTSNATIYCACYYSPDAWGPCCHPAVVLRELRPGAAAVKVAETSVREQSTTFNDLKSGVEYTLEVVAVNTCGDARGGTTRHWQHAQTLQRL